MRDLTLFFSSGWISYPSGTAYQFIASRKYLPDAFSPVHQLWIEMAVANGVPMTKIRDSMVRSVGGIVMKNKVAAQIKSRHGEISVKALIDGVVQGNVAMGYTDPFASSTGLNFLVTVLSTFSGGDESKLLFPDVVSAFQEFQRSVPFVAMTTLHMRESVSRVGGSLDAFVMGHQTFSKTRELTCVYQFIPFGVPHDHPLYAVDNPGPEKLEVLGLLARYAEESKNLKLAKDYGWNQPIAGNYQSSVPMPSGGALIRAQKLWKEQKDAGRPIAAVFLCDISGSMQGSRINGVREALITGSEFISPDNSIGLVFFNNAVVEVLEIKRFNLLQRASFVAAVEDMDASGGTAMYNGIAYALSLLLKAKETDPQVKPMLFVLTDGQTQSGLKFEDMRAVIEGVRVPVYTIGYEADLKELKRLSSLVEAASINAGEGQIEYKIGALLNAQM